MVLELAVSSIEKKLQMQASVIVGNYEFYYAAGKLAARTTLAADEMTPPLLLKEQVDGALKSFSAAPEDKKAAYLVYLLDRYRPSEAYDEQMAQLFRMGKDS
jgi:hypothetical protein